MNTNNKKAFWPRFAVLLAPIALAMIAGCFRPPFERVELVPLGDVEPLEIADEFEARLPEYIETESDSIRFKFLWEDISALGYARIDREARTFEVLCMNHVGVQLFHISGTEDASTLRFALPQLKDIPGFVESLGEDIRRIYFDMVPGPDADIRLSKKRLTWREELEDGRLEYVFGGEPPVLIEKRFRSGLLRRTRWSVEYFEYGDESGPLFPRGVVLHNRQHRYRLIIRTRNVSFGQSD